MPVFLKPPNGSFFYSLLNDDDPERPRLDVERPDVFGFLHQQRLVYCGDPVARRFQADSLATTGNWKSDRLFGERFYLGQPYLFVEFKLTEGRFVQAGFVIEIFDRAEIAIDRLEDDQAGRIRAAAGELLEQVGGIGAENEISPLVQWERSFDFLLKNGAVEIAARPPLITPAVDANFNPSWILGALLDHSPFDVRRVARVSAFYRTEPGGTISNAVARWVLMFGSSGNPLSVPFDYPLEGAGEAPVSERYSEIERRERDALLLPALFIWAALGEETAVPTGRLPQRVAGRGVIERSLPDREIIDASGFTN